MAKPRVTATDRLQNVIEVVELGRRSGLLSVERGNPPALEEGEIYFMSGRAIYAAVASLRGREALAVLGRWGGCRFAFDPNAPRPTPNVSGVLPSLDMVDHPRGMRPSPPAPAPSGPFGQPSGPFNVPSGPLSGSSGPFGAPGETSGAWRVGPSVPPYGSSPGLSGPMGQMPDPLSNPAVMYPGTNPNLTPQEGGQSGAYGQNPLLLRRPRRAPDVRDLMSIVTAYNLSRGHRTILLLADGEHSVLDLARLSSKSVDEVSQLLAELESYGLVYYAA